MNNRDIDSFFQNSSLTDSVEKVERYPNVMWGFSASRHQLMIQTQEDANRMRIVAFIANESDLDRPELCKLMEANYHSALDARYALADGKLVSLYLHPFKELTATQFTLGLYQTIMCAQTFGSSYTGGTMFFGSSGGRGADSAENSIHDILREVVSSIKR